MHQELAHTFSRQSRRAAARKAAPMLACARVSVRPCIRAITTVDAFGNALGNSLVERPKKGTDPEATQDASARYRTRRATEADIAEYHAAERDLAAAPFRKIFDQENPDQFVISAFFDGTWNKRGNGGLEDTRPGIDHTNVGILQWLSEGAENNRSLSRYFEGVGTDWYSKYIGGATGAGMSARVEDAYKWSVDQANEIAKGNPNASFDFLAVGFSRGAVQARMLLRVLDERGIPDTRSGYQVQFSDGTPETRFERYLVPARQANLNAVLFDSVATGFADLYDLEVPGRAQVYHAIAKDEMRPLFPSSPLAKVGQELNPSWFQRALAGDHSDVGNNHDRGGLGDWNLKLAHQFMSVSLGLPVSPIPDAYLPKPERLWVHSLSGGRSVTAVSNNAEQRNIAPRYLPYTWQKND